MSRPCSSTSIRASSLLGLLLPGCLAAASAPPAPAPARPPAVRAAADPWMSDVHSRLQAGVYAPRRQGDGYRLRSPERGLAATFGVRGARLQREDGEGFAVRTVGWGRGDERTEVRHAAPAPGACADDREDIQGQCIPRLEYSSDGLTEWWTADGEGLEQGWTVRARPPGAGPLMLEVEIDGAEVSQGEDELRLDTEGGGSWIVSGLVAWDADGEALPARLLRLDGGMRIAVEDEGARYPIEIDPVYTDAEITWTGSASSGFGFSVAGAGDVNGDGYDDVIIGTNTGDKAWLYLGAPEGLSSTASQELEGAADGEGFGWSVSCAGDVNGDGYDDVIVGAPLASSNKGKAYLFFGDEDGPSSSADTTWTGSAGGQFFGGSVSGAGDVNGDGYDDILVGSPAASSNKGKVYLYLGAGGGVSSAASKTLTGSASSGDFGLSVAGAGDVNGDAKADVIIGAPYANSGKGTATLYYGSGDTVLAETYTTFTGAKTNDHLGYSVSGAGDLNQDGYDDVIVGASQAEGYSGVAYLWSGAAVGLTSGSASTADATLRGDSHSVNFAWSVSAAGDVDGDGYDDVIVSSPARYLSIGAAWIFLGSDTGVSTSASAVLTGSAEYSHFGWDVSSAGDVNGDGYADVIVGSFVFSPTALPFASVYLGYTSDEDGDTFEADEDCDDGDPSVKPDATEIVGDGVDQDCDGVELCYVDSDGDGSYVSSTATVTSPDLLCDGPGEASASAFAGDCDDSDAAFYPGAAEGDCEDPNDYNCDGSTGTDDLDGDAWIACEECDDGDPDINPSATEVPYDGADNDCAGGDVRDADEDGYDAEAAGGEDCDDLDPTIYPGGVEVPDDGIDNDCDDDSALSDADGDGYVSEDWSGDDCDDDNVDVNPGATEIPYDGLDNDCVDWDLKDVDEDGYPSTEVDGDDCDDEDATISPEAAETPDDGIDQDCDGADLLSDEDGDGYINQDAGGDDCDDQDPAVGNECFDTGAGDTGAGDTGAVDEGPADTGSGDWGNGDKESSAGCGCATSSTPSHALWLGLIAGLATLTRRRDRRA